MFAIPYLNCRVFDRHEPSYWTGCIANNKTQLTDVPEGDWKCSDGDYGMGVASEITKRRHPISPSPTFGKNDSLYTTNGENGNIYRCHRQSGSGGGRLVSLRPAFSIMTFRFDNDGHSICLSPRYLELER